MYCVTEQVKTKDLQMESMLLLTEAGDTCVRLTRWERRKLSVENPIQKRATIKKKCWNRILRKSIPSKKLPVFGSVFLKINCTETKYITYLF